MDDKHFSVDFDFTFEELAGEVPPQTAEQINKLRQCVFDEDGKWIKKYMEGITASHLSDNPHTKHSGPEGIPQRHQQGESLTTDR